MIMIAQPHLNHMDSLRKLHDPILTKPCIPSGLPETMLNSPIKSATDHSLACIGRDPAQFSSRGCSSGP